LPVWYWVVLGPAVIFFVIVPNPAPDWLANETAASTTPAEAITKFRANAIIRMMKVFLSKFYKNLLYSSYWSILRVNY
jgi:hypothetical protein